LKQKVKDWKVLNQKLNFNLINIYIKTIIAMTKFILTEEEKNRILGLYEQPTAAYTNPIQPPGKLMKKYDAEAYVDDDSISWFTVTKFVTSGSNVKIFVENNTMYSNNFTGPLYDAKTNKQVYRDVTFTELSKSNYKQIANKYNIPLQ